MTANFKEPPTDPFAEGVRASECAIALGDDFVNPLDAPANGVESADAPRGTDSPPLAAASDRAVTRVKRRRTAADDPWRNNLIVSTSGVPKPLFANAITALRDCLTWQCALAFDEFASETILVREPPWFSGREWANRPWTPQDDLQLTNWLQHQGIAVNVPTAAQAVEAVARDQSFHPVGEYLEGQRQQHDGKARLSTWLRDYLGSRAERLHRHGGPLHNDCGRGAHLQSRLQGRHRSYP